MIKFTEDKLNRKSFLNDMFNLFENFGNQGNRGFTMILNGKYGSGKSTLLNFIQEKNEQDKKFSIIQYNAWENNLFDNPMIPILYEISKLEKTSSKIKDVAKGILKNIPQVILGTLSNAHSVDLTSLISNESVFDDYDKYKESLNKFRSVLIEYCRDKKVLFLIDELDRCLPEYQIKVLESLYHLLEVPNLIVVIALDREQLECAIENRFGDAQNTLGYLAKFINYQVDLPNDENDSFLMSLMSFECVNVDTESVKIIIANMLDLMHFSVRECQMIINEINLICRKVDNSGELRPVYYWYPLLVSFIVIVKYKYDRIYKKWFYKERQDDYSAMDIKFKDCLYNEFLQDISSTDLQYIIDYLFKENTSALCQAFLLNLINSFSSILNIDKQELLDYLDMNEQYFNYLRVEYGFTRQESVNVAIRSVKILKFK